LSKGNQPRPPAKVPKNRLSGKGCELAITTRMLAQRQPSFKECVTAHWSSVLAPKMNGAQAYYRSCGFILPSGNLSGRGAYFNE
jgi:hypothetical protein